MSQNQRNPARRVLPSGRPGPLGPGGWRGRNRELRLEVVARNAELRAQRSDVEQIKVLDARLGKLQGAKRERARLAAAK